MTGGGRVLRPKYRDILDDGLTVVVLANSGNCDPHLIADEVAAIYFGKRTPTK